MKKMILALAVALSASQVMAAHDAIESNAQQFDCKVVGVLDGDTIDCLTADFNKVRVRLAEIDAPEKSQAFGQKSKQRLSDYVFGKTVTVAFHQQDRYGRIIGEVYAGLPSVNYLMVQDGLAWAYERYNRDRAYITAQQKAKAERKGLWVDKNPIIPENYRHNN